MSDECEWSFSGYIGAYNNPFDFNPGKRELLKEIATRVIGFFGPLDGGMDYKIKFEGHRPVHDGGKW